MFPALIWSDGELLRRVSVRLEVEDHERVIRGMTHGGVADTVPSSRAMDFHTPLV
jgi:hypothetical protein